jgi:alpha-tubulin suppressor-like RCC1 family protein
MEIDKSALLEKLKTIIEGNYFIVSPSVEDILFTALSSKTLEEVSIITVKDVDSLPQLNYYNSPSGMLYYLEDLAIYAISSSNKWLTLDGRLLREDDRDSFSLLLSWGNNLRGQLGDDTSTCRSSPLITTSGFIDWCQVSAGFEHSVGVRENGTAWAWGSNCSDQLGAGLSGCLSCKSSPVIVAGDFDDWCQVSAGCNHSLGLRTNGTAWAWGTNYDGELGTNNQIRSNSPVQVGDFGDTDIYEYTSNTITWSFTSLSGLANSAVPTDGTVPLGFWELSIPWEIKFIGEFYDKLYVSTESYITFGKGSLQSVSTLSASKPSVPKIMLSAREIYGGFSLGTTIYYGTEGTAPNRTYRIYFTGYSDYDFFTGKRSHGWEVIFFENDLDRIDVTLLGSQLGGINGIYTRLGERIDDGFVSREPGEPTLKYELTSNLIEGSNDPPFADWEQVSAGRRHSIGLRSNGTIWSWGGNYKGQLGDNTVGSDKSSPVIVAGDFDDWCQVSAGACHSLAVRTNGTAWSWGWNRCGQLGNGLVYSSGYNYELCCFFTEGDASSPVSVVGGFTDWCQVSAGYNHSLGLRSNGSLWSWGSNNLGQLGNGNATTSSSPVSVVGGFTDWCRVSTGNNHNLGLRSNGSLWSWGNNNLGQLGDLTSSNKLSPVSVLGGINSWTSISAGGYHSLGVIIKC